MTPQELRSSVFRFAISGKLTRQNKLEDSKSVINSAISERIKAECAKSIKKEKNIKSISDDEIPFEIPDNWSWVRLYQISSIEAGGTPDRGTPEYWNGDVPWLKIGDINSKHVTNCTEHITKLGLDNSSAKIFNKGTILYTIFATIGRVGILDFDASTNQAIAGITFYGNLNRDYLYYVLVSLKDVLVAQSHGMAQMNINQAILKQTPIPIPPIEEQDRIVAKIEELLPLVDRYEEAWNKLELLNKKFPVDMEKSIIGFAMRGKLVEQRLSEGSGETFLKEIIEQKKIFFKQKKIDKDKKTTPITEDDKPYDIPPSWRWTKLQIVLDKLVDGDHNPPQGVNYETDYWMLSSTNIGNGVIENLDKKRFLTKEVFEIENERTRAKKGDIFFTSVGTLGRSCIYNGEGNYCFQRSVSIMHTLIYNKFLKYYFDSPYFQSMVAREATGTAQKGFYLQQLADSYVPIPPLEEQKRIVAKIEELLPLCRKLVK